MTDTATPDSDVGPRTPRFFEWMNGNIRLITIGIAIVTIAAVFLAAGRSEDDPNFDPTGEIYDTARAEATVE